MKRTLVALTLLPCSLILSACGGGDDDPSSGDGADTITVKGQMTLNDSDNEGSGGECYGTGGYDDMRGGAQVVIRDGEGKSVGLGQLDPGNADVQYPTVSCHFAFSVADVPAGLGIYSVEVANRGAISFKEADAGSVELALGS